jgi:hypothetical protein
MTVTIETSDRIPVEVNFKCSQCCRPAYRVNVSFGRPPMIDEAVTNGYLRLGDEIFCRDCATEIHAGMHEQARLTYAG